MRNTALVAGASGIVGRHLLRHLLETGDWTVIAVSRRRPDVEGAFRHVAVDLLDAEACHAALGEFCDVTHVFHCAYTERATPAEAVAPNLAMLRHVVEAIEPAAPDLGHVHLIEGTKWYGSHLGPFKTPARENDPRHMPPNFYYDQQDWLAARQRGKAWRWSAARPHAVCGFAAGSPMNLATAIAVFATISKELGVPLCHPGPVGSDRVLYQVTDARLLARAMTWMATTPACANEAFNITNGDYFRWETMWPAIARCFDMPAGPPRPLNLAVMMADKEPLWARLVERHGLPPHRLAEIAPWRFLDQVFASTYDVMSDTMKARRHGFPDFVDSETMFQDIFDEFRAQRIIP